MNSEAEEKQLANRLRWDGRRRGWYEVYFLKWNEPRSRTAGWIRYTLTSPIKQDPYCELWAVHFAEGNPTKIIAVRQRHPLEEFFYDSGSTVLQIAGSEFGPGHCRGAVRDDAGGHELRWELSLESTGPVLYHYPWKRLYDFSIPRTKVLSPHVDARFSGRMTVDGNSIRLESARGQQSHLWGSKHNLRWCWGHCNNFVQDPAAVWEGMDGQIKHGPVPSAHFKMFYLRAFGREHIFNAPMKWLFNRSRAELGAWEFEAGDREVRMRGRVNARAEDFIGVTYVDPDGEQIFCNNTKLASINIRLEFAGGRGPAELTAEKCCALEHADRRPHPRVPVRL